MTFSFILCDMSLLVILVTYFGIGLGDLVGGKPLKDNKICCYQH